MIKQESQQSSARRTAARLTRAGLAGGVLLSSLACGGPATSTSAGEPATPSGGPRVVQAGAPGEPSRAYEGASLDEVEGTEHTQADVDFMQGMITHHAQALAMTALIPERTDTRAVHQMGLRMEISQADEIGIMERWLRERDLEVPDWQQVAETGRAAHQGADHADMDHGDMMPGMLTPEQMERLEDAEGRAFDQLFLELMIQHHQGALTMVMDLYNSAGAAQESTVYLFASEIDADQTIEIRRMQEVLEAWR
ncbi:MAG: DUF305 domain-containing protein [Gemmatimonadota bacterium]|nr:DUF305 domain-containing protein [Gemmatimonadota bacterium]